MGMLTEAYDLGTLPFSTNLSVPSFLHKSGATTLSVLTNCDYNIVAFVFAKRLQHVLSF